MKRQIFKDFILVAKLINESTIITFEHLRDDKTRTLLSVLGITVGIFCIVAVFTIISTMEHSIQKSFELVSPNVIQISQYPNFTEDESGDETLEGSEYKWWEYIKRPHIRYADYKFLSSHSITSQAITLSASLYTNIKVEKQSLNSVEVRGIAHNYIHICNADIPHGRYFSLNESEYGVNVAILGDYIATELFRDAESAIGKIIQVKGRKIKVIGVFQKQGDGPIGSMFSLDYALFIPFALCKYYMNTNNTPVVISVIPKKEIANTEFKLEIINLLRASRRLTPSDKNNFSINTVVFLQKAIDSVYAVINLAGVFIASFSLLIGGFGIANIMFVSVNERTNIIGIQRALGAKRYFILLQFLFESIWLSIIGAIAGILILYVIISLIPPSDNFTLDLTYSNVFKGIGISFIIGMIAGIVPAWNGATLKPIDAINFK